MFGKSKNNIRINTKNAKLIKAFPTSYSEARIIAKELLNGNVVVLDVSKASKTDAVRMVDLLAGVLLAINGDYKRMAPMTFLLTPKKSMIEHYYKILRQNHSQNNFRD